MDAQETEKQPFEPSALIEYGNVADVTENVFTGGGGNDGNGVGYS